MEIKLFDEFQLNSNYKEQIRSQLKSCFSDEAYDSRIYYKQRAHYRLIALEGNLVLGQMGLDYRVMTLGGKAIQVLGIIDFTVEPSYQSQGIGSELLKNLDDIANEFKDNIDFIMLMADKHNIYLKHNYLLKNQLVKWIGIHAHEIVGDRQEKANYLMIKSIGNKKWDDSALLDMLGYMY